MRRCAVLCFLALCCAPPFTAAQPALAALDFAAGKALFERNWVPAPASTRSADGLGPHYATRSCAACHEAGGRGRAPAAFSLHLDDPRYGRRLLGRSVGGVPPETGIAWLETACEAASPCHSNPLTPAWRFTLTGLTQGEPTSPISIRLAPSLRGLALLEAIPRTVLEGLADPDDSNGDAISGRLALLASGQEGRFGWKAAVPTLEEQLQLALALDLGLGNPAFPAPWGDCTAAQSQCRELALASADPTATLEVDATMTHLLLTYLHQLPPPSPLPQAAAGEQLLAELGCAACHVPLLASPLGEVKAYTDLLLHDLGPGLGDGLPEAAAAADEWRTAPLWDLSQEGPFLHDGRARTLDEAVAWHGGEAQRSSRAYQALDARDKAVLSAFLLGL
jgi:CxxC motif-containing protein (DUF1111 family)